MALGKTSKYHQGMAKVALRSMRVEAKDAIALSKEGRCFPAFNRLLIARGAQDEARAHIRSLPSRDADRMERTEEKTKRLVVAARVAFYRNCVRKK